MDAKQARALKHLVGPGGRTVRERYARGKRNEAARSADVDRAVARRGPVSGGAPIDFAKQRIAVGRGFHN